jgi:ABC-2 type transport system ATP-binding protein
MLGLIKPTSGSIIINHKNIENNRTSLLEKMNFISPYIELPKKLTIEENLKVYGRLYGVKNLKEKIYDLMEKLTYLNLDQEKLANFLQVKKIECLWLKL